MKSLLSNVITAIVGLWLASMFVAGAGVTLFADSNFFGFALTQTWEIFVLLGVVLGLINFFIKPILDTITFPLRIITLGLFGIVVEMILVFGLDYLFREFSAPLLYPLFWTALIVWTLNIIANNTINKIRPLLRNKLKLSLAAG